VQPLKYNLHSIVCVYYQLQLMSKKLLLFILTGILFIVTRAQNNWVLKGNRDGILVYTRSMPDSKVKSIKVECTLPVTLSQMVFIILDIDASKQWIYSTKSATTIKQVSPAELYYYSELDMPWPVTNRDFIAHIKVTQDAATKVVTVNAENVPGFVALKPNIVRVKESVGKWLFTPAGPNAVKVEYTLFTDPGGSLPAWLVNMFITKGPYESFSKLKQHIKGGAHANAKLPFIKD